MDDLTTILNKRIAGCVVNSITINRLIYADGLIPLSTSILGLTKERKKNPEAFYKYAQSKLKTRTGTPHFAREDGSLTTTDKQKADLLNNFFSSVFTREDTNNMPDTVTSHTDSVPHFQER